MGKIGFAVTPVLGAAKALLKNIGKITYYLFTSSMVPVGWRTPHPSKLICLYI
jgi:hypothetical protein